MAQSEAVFVIILGISILAIAAYIIQKVDNQRQLQRNLKHAINQNIAQVDHLLQSIPSALMTEPLYNYLTYELRNLCLQKNQIDKDPKSAQYLEWANQLVSNGFEKSTSSSSLTLLENEADLSPSTLAIIELAKWLNQQSSHNPELTNELLHYSKACLDILSIDKMIFEAIRCETEKGPQVAIHQFRNCLFTLENQLSTIQSDLQLYKIRTHIDELEQTIACVEQSKT
jgi:hypothetical protein